MGLILAVKPGEEILIFSGNDEILIKVDDVQKGESKGRAILNITAPKTASINHHRKNFKNLFIKNTQGNGAESE